MDTTSRVRHLIDEARQYLTDGEILVSRGINALPEEEVAAILDAVRTLKDFSPRNDPYGEHDFGAFEHNGRRILARLVMVSLDPRHPRRLQAENPLMPLSRFSRLPLL